MLLPQMVLPVSGTDAHSVSCINTVLQTQICLCHVIQGESPLHAAVGYGFPIPDAGIEEKFVAVGAATRNNEVLAAMTKQFVSV